MKDSPIYFADERWEKLEADVQEIKNLLQRLLNRSTDRLEPGEEILCARDVARLLSIDIATVYSRCAKGAIPHFKVGRQYKFRQSDINAWLEKGALDSPIDIDEYVNQYLQKINIKG